MGLSKIFLLVKEHWIISLVILAGALIGILEITTGIISGSSSSEGYSCGKCAEGTKVCEQTSFTNDETQTSIKFANYLASDITSASSSDGLTSRTSHTNIIDSFEEGDDGTQNGGAINPYEWTDEGFVKDIITDITWIPFGFKCTWDEANSLGADGDIEAWYNANSKQYYDNKSLSEVLVKETCEPLNISQYGTGWKIAGTKELYSLIDFSGAAGQKNEEETNTDGIKFINTNYFNIQFGDAETSGVDNESDARYIDGQCWGDDGPINLMTSSPSCSGSGGDDSVFGVNFIDGRIKSYPKVQGGKEAVKLVLFMKQGINDISKSNFVPFGSNTVIQDGKLEWQKEDSGDAKQWSEAVQYCQSLEIDGKDDWRLPNVKELQSLIDYNKTFTDTECNDFKYNMGDSSFGYTTVDTKGDPDTDGTPGWYWSGTTHYTGSPTDGSAAYGAYVAFGPALGHFAAGGGDAELMDVHGAGAQRSDPKTESEAQSIGTLSSQGYYYHGPQGDIVRGKNLVRCVRSVISTDTIPWEGFRFEVPLWSRYSVYSKHSKS